MTAGPTGEALLRFHNFKHDLNERIPVRNFYESLDHIYSLVIELGLVGRQWK